MNKMEKKVKFAVIGDCHYSAKGNYSTRDCLGAKTRLASIIERLNEEELRIIGKGMETNFTCRNPKA